MADSRPRLVVRQLRRADLKTIQEIQRRSFPIEPWTREQLESQLTVFPEGQIGVEIQCPERRPSRPPDETTRQAAAPRSSGGEVGAARLPRPPERGQRGDGHGRGS